MFFKKDTSLEVVEQSYILSRVTLCIMQIALTEFSFTSAKAYLYHSSSNTLRGRVCLSSQTLSGLDPMLSCDCLLTKHHHPQNGKPQFKTSEGLQMEMPWHALKLRLGEAMA